MRQTENHSKNISKANLRIKVIPQGVQDNLFMGGDLILKTQSFNVIIILFLLLLLGCTRNESGENNVDVLEKIIIPQETDTMIDMFEPKRIESSQLVLDSLSISYTRFDPLRKCFHCGYLIEFVTTIIDIEYFRKIKSSNYVLFCENEYVCKIDISQNDKEERRLVFRITNESSNNTDSYVALQNLIYCLRKGNLKLSSLSNTQKKVDLVFNGEIPVKITMY